MGCVAPRGEKIAIQRDNCAKSNKYSLGTSLIEVLMLKA
jgi:hypothetical protein